MAKGRVRMSGIRCESEEQNKESMKSGKVKNWSSRWAEVRGGNSRRVNNEDKKEIRQCNKKGMRDVPIR